MPTKILLLSALCLTFGCSSLSSQSSAKTSSTSSSCRSCERMCEVAGDAQNNASAVTKCKNDCAQSCQ